MNWRSKIERIVLDIWYKKHFIAYLLLPLSYLFYLIIIVRRFCYQKNIFKKHTVPVPVIVVGNITVGGSGKTPLVVWLTQMLLKEGYKPGIISRGYGAKSLCQPRTVTTICNVTEVGDEPLMLAQQTNCPIVISPDRVAAAKQLLEHAKCNVIISDDGLQHYALSRTIEVTVVDAQRKFGNGFLLPAGPLRETVKRLDEVDFIVVNGKHSLANSFNMELRPSYFVNIKDGSHQALNVFTAPVHAVAAIGNPVRFFNQLKELGLTIIEHTFADHYPFCKDDFSFVKPGETVIMTAKDAVKCTAFATENFWYLAVNPVLPTDFKTLILKKL